MSDAPLMIGIPLPTSATDGAPLDMAAVGATAEWAEAAGFDIVWSIDHLFHARQMLESMTTLAYVAGRTKRIKIGTAVYLLALRSVAVASKQIATLSSLSGGRLVMGIGVGGEWPKEWEAAGVPTSERGARLNEALPLIRRLFSGEEVDFSGRFNSFPGVKLMPVPPPVPFYLAGRAAPALKRAALMGDGWLGFFLTLNGFKRDTAQILAMREEAGLAGQPYNLGMLLCFRFDKDNEGAKLRAAEAMNAGFPPGTELTPADKLQHVMIAGTPDSVLEQLQAFVAAGCRTFCLTPVGEGSEYTEQLEILAAEVLPRLRSSGTEPAAPVLTLST